MPVEVDKNNGYPVGGNLLISVFTPTWNRAHLLPRVYASLEGQTVRNFEWIVFDDGSTDGTQELVESLFDVASFPVRYVKVPNRGKASAINQGVLLAIGELFLVLDSDDAASSNAMERFGKVWEGLATAGVRERYMGMSSLKVDFCGRQIGDDYAGMDGKALSYIDRKNLGVRGDKWEVLRTDLARSVPYPIHESERYMAPSYVWLVLARDYLTCFMNEPLGIVEYQEDGISANNIKHRVGSPRTTYRYYQKFFRVGLFSWKARLAFSANVNRFALHGGGCLVVTPMTLVAMPIAIVAYLADRWRLKRMARLSLRSGA